MLQVFWWPPQCSWQHSQRKEHTGCLCAFRFAAVVSNKYRLLHISFLLLLLGCCWWTWMASASLWHTHILAISTSHHDRIMNVCHIHTAALGCPRLRWLCPLRLLQDVWPLMIFRASRPRPLYYSKYQIPTSVITSRSMCHVQPDMHVEPLHKHRKRSYLQFWVKIFILLYCPTLYCVLSSYVTV